MSRLRQTVVLLVWRPRDDDALDGFMPVRLLEALRVRRCHRDQSRVARVGGDTISRSPGLEPVQFSTRIKQDCTTSITPWSYPPRFRQDVFINITRKNVT